MTTLTTTRLSPPHHLICLDEPCVDGESEVQAAFKGVTEATIQGLRWQVTGRTMR